MILPSILHMFVHKHAVEKVHWIESNEAIYTRRRISETNILHGKANFGQKVSPYFRQF